MLQLNFFSDNNLGMYARATDKILLVGSSISDSLIEKIAGKMKTVAVKTTVANSELVGIFCCLNSNGLVLSKIATDDEIKTFQNLTKELGMNFSILKTKFTAVGNLVLCNDKGAVISNYFSQKNRKLIEDCLGVESVQAAVAGMPIVGSAGIATNKGCLLHRDTNESEIKAAGEILKVNVDIGTANFGSPFVGCCVIANSNDLIVGENTTGPEITRMQEALGFI